MDGVQDLRLLFASHHALIVAALDDETRFMAYARSAADLCGFPVWTWSVTRGLARDDHPSQVDTKNLQNGLAFVQQLSDPGVFVFHDALSSMEEPTPVRLAKEVALAAKPGQTLVLTGARSQMPPEFDGLALAWRLEPPARDEVRSVVDRTVATLRARGLVVDLTDDDLDGLVTASLGLSLPEIERAIIREGIDDHRLDAADIDAVRNAKAELLADDGVLRLVAAELDLDDVGGMDHLKAWLGVRGRGFEPGAVAFGLEAPRGLLIAGIPGCGKSLTAKCVAASWDLPLVLLDPGSIFGSYVGQSEERLRTALTTVEAMAPVVLWIDEIEKGFSGGSSDADAGAARRVLGGFLRWLQERPSGVFLVATCNQVERLPAELLRRGRFDEIFFVDLPDREERAQILGLHLRRRRRETSTFDLVALADASDGFTGAELEGAVVGALFRAYGAGHDVTMSDLLDELHHTTPLARTRAEDVAALRRWAHGRAVMASGEPPPVDPGAEAPPGYV